MFVRLVVLTPADFSYPLLLLRRAIVLEFAPIVAAAGFFGGFKEPAKPLWEILIVCPAEGTLFLEPAKPTLIGILFV